MPRAIPTFTELVLWSIAAVTGGEAVAGQASALVESSRPATMARAKESVVRALRDSRNADSPPADELASSLAQGGDAGLDAMLDILVERRIPALLPEEREQVLSVPQRQLLLEALSHFGQVGVDAIESRISEDPSLEERIATVYVYAAAGESRDLERVLELALEEDEEELQSALEEALEAAFAQILTRDPDGFGSLAFTIGHARSELHKTLVLAIGATKDPRGIEVLADLLPFHEELVDVAVAQTRLLGRSGDPDVNARLAAEIWQFLDGDRIELACSVARALGDLAVCESVQELIYLLDSESTPLREDAHWALRRLSRCNYPATRQSWQRWYDSEQDWWNAESQRVFWRLERGKRVDRLQALQTLGDRTLHRDEIAQRVAAELDEQDVHCRKRTCQVLGQLRSPAGSLALVSALDDESFEVRTAAREALAEIHGIEIPESPEACRILLRL